ncbi:Gfo/Idh/MocA family protein [Paenibacillus agricola]|uniref:Gfo/Idh/MocA family oxidoreductase n=1 Tax=Paenibacillus agricola TaxID=2716264 RepID=A0ABX0JCI8_9BACL|nr:Gfo/Idh/MocA family oxidoreductase [Paenibacillus agricola]NHN32959.1 Gfo/Idh/MocA family oxidoreductase [Paenibacillus agricola]
MKKKIGLIGLGDIAQKVYLPLLAADPQVEIAGITSRTAATVNRIADQYRISGRFETVEALLEKKLDAVFIHSPTETHYDVVMACLNKGIAVYVDKPLSYELGESEAMARYAQAQGVLLAVGFNRRFAPMYSQARAWLDEAGGFEMCIVHKHRTKLQAHSAKHTLYDDMIHMLDLLLWLGGEDYEVGNYFERSDEAGKLLVGAGSLVFKADNRLEGRTEDGVEAKTGGSMGQFSMVRRAGADLEKLELHGAYRSAEVVNMEAAVLSQKSAAPQSIGFGSWDTILDRRGFAGIVQHFLSCLEQPELCSVRADRVLPSHELVERLSRP